MCIGPLIFGGFVVQVAFMIDGGFFIKKFKEQTKTFPSPHNVRDLCDKALKDPDLQGDQLFRIYYYDCLPFSGTSVHPLTGVKTDYSATHVYKRQNQFLRDLKLCPRVAFRSGTLSNEGWKIPPSKMKEVIRKIGQGIPLDPFDFVINLSQKKVDIKIGLDMAWLASKKIVEKVVLVTGDSDLVPAMKFARREGVMVYLLHFSHGIKEELKEHCDGIVNVRP